MVVAAVEDETPKRKKRSTLNASASSVTPSPKKQKTFATLNDHGDNGFGDDYTPSRRGLAAATLLNRPTIVPKPDLQEVDLSHVSDTLKSKNIQASNLKFGFLGLGIMGCGIVKNLINSKHKVFVWNRTTNKCRKFVDAGAEFLDTPSDVIEQSDITFSCVSDPQVCKEVSF